jgi:hypothetical protein
VFGCRQEVNFQGVCLNGTHPSLLTNLEFLLIFHVKLAVRIVCGQCYESTSVPALSEKGPSAKISRSCELLAPSLRRPSASHAGQNSSRYGQTLLTYRRE